MPIPGVLEFASRKKELGTGRLKLIVTPHPPMLAGFGQLEITIMMIMNYEMKTTKVVVAWPTCQRVGDILGCSKL